jgi:hypothetical protein
MRLSQLKLRREPVRERQHQSVGTVRAGACDPSYHARELTLDGVQMRLNLPWKLVPS